MLTRLTLGRREGESIQAGDVKITITEAGYGRAKVTIEAPREVPIARSELLSGTKTLADFLSRKITRNKQQPPRAAIA